MVIELTRFARQVLGQTIHLPRKSPAGETEHDAHPCYQHEDGRDAAQSSLQPAHRRRPDEREQDGECDGHAHRPAPNGERRSPARHLRT